MFERDPISGGHGLSVQVRCCVGRIRIKGNSGEGDEREWRWGEDRGWRRREGKRWRESGERREVGGGERVEVLRIEVYLPFLCSVVILCYYMK